MSIVLRRQLRLESRSLQNLDPIKWWGVCTLLLVRHTVTK
jgi:hypothetical protein